MASLMLYGYYARFGVYMLQDGFRLLGLRQDRADIKTVTHGSHSVNGIMCALTWIVPQGVV